MRNAPICAARGCDGCNVCLPRTDWMDANDDPVREGVYELLNESTGKTFFARWIVKEGFYYFYVGWGRGDHDIEAAASETEHGIVQKRWPWRGLQFKWWVIGCKANRDGECNWLDCPQIKDGEPVKSGRHCPLDVENEND